MVHFNLDLDNQKYIMKFLPYNKVKIMHTGNENKFVVVQYFSDTKVVDFMQYVKSLDFSKLKDKTLYTFER